MAKVPVSLAKGPAGMGPAGMYLVQVFLGRAVCRMGPQVAGHTELWGAGRTEPQVAGHTVTQVAGRTRPANKR